MQLSLNFIHEIICSFYDEGLLSLLIGHLRPIGCKWMNPCMKRKLTKHVKNHNMYKKYKIAYDCILYLVFFFMPSTFRAWHMLYLFINMLRAFLHTLYKSKFLHTCIQPYGFFHKGLYISFEVDIIFFRIWGT